MAAIPDTGGARCALRGVMRALLRLVVLGSLITAGWLLGSGTSHADEDPDQPETGLVQLVSDRIARTAAPDVRPGGRVELPPAVGSTAKKALSTVRVQRLPVQPPVMADVPKPAGLGQPDILKPLAPATRAVSESVPAVQPPEPASRSAAVPPAAPTMQAIAAPVPVLTTNPAAVAASEPTAGLADTSARSSVGHVPTGAPVSAAADTVGELPAPGDGPAAPVPASPPASTTAPSLTGSSGGGAGTKGVPIVAVQHTWTMAGLTPTHRLRYLGAGDLPRSPAAEPSTFPD